ncbi:MAG: TAXI family TRAP transporter solute-binding subunit, partial [Gammaproteobacteria bacterium]|nr:TAXI family TRAP transporter solute-binding subunit [Gammaproteobacteria bacterium]
MRKLLKLSLGTLLVFAVGSPAVLAEKFVTIGTGGQTGVYYVVGQSICKLVNRGTKKHDIKCTAPSTG